MNVQNDISQELRLLSELVATISRQTPYRVADDYFPNLSSRVMLRIEAQGKPMAFNVPEGYFEGFAEGVLARIKAGAAAAPEAGAGTGVGGGMKAGASGGLSAPQSVETELAGLSPLLAQLRPLATYRMPEGYFEELSPILSVARNTNPYTVPEEYFHQLPTEIEEKLLEPQKEVAALGKRPAKIVAFGSRRTNWLRYSAAAAVAGLILTFGWMRFSGSGGEIKPGIAEGNAIPNLPKVPDQDLQIFLADHENQDQPASEVAANQEFSDSDFKSLLGEVPDGALKEYMDEHGGADDMATN